jgi:hypothetical protein
VEKRIDVALQRLSQALSCLTKRAAGVMHYKVNNGAASATSEIIIQKMSLIASAHCDFAIIRLAPEYVTRSAGPSFINLCVILV